MPNQQMAEVLHKPGFREFGKQNVHFCRRYLGCWSLGYVIDN